MTAQSALNRLMHAEQSAADAFVILANAGHGNGDHVDCEECKAHKLLGGESLTMMYHDLSVLESEIPDEDWVKEEIRYAVEDAEESVWSKVMPALRAILRGDVDTARHEADWAIR